jgi:ubiquinone/menaquinone biosynthesis C-methylase UbiE
MNRDPNIPEHFCDPVSRKPLEWTGDGFRTLDGRQRYPYRDGIFTFLPDGPAPIRHRFWQWVYDRLAFGYDWGVRFAWGLPLGGSPIRRADYLDRIEIQPGQAVLDTAAGTGGNIEHLPDHADYTLLDISRNMLTACKNNLHRWGRHAYLVQADAARLPFYSDSFDAAIHMGGLQFLSNPAEGIFEMCRVTRPGGLVWIIDEAYSIPRLVSQPRYKLLRQPSRDKIERLRELLPPNAVDIQIELISGGELYYLHFRKS